MFKSVVPALAEQGAEQPTAAGLRLDGVGLPVEDVVSVYVVDARRTIPLRGRSEYTIGRVSEDQPIIPDVDLTEFEAYIQGVSRLHAALKVGRQRLSIRDLGSSNGTRVNGQRIVPHVDYPLKPGDSVALGKLVIQVLVSTP